MRYQGKFGAIPVTVLNPKPGFVWKPLPQHNYIDRLVDAKLERLKIQPSGSTDDATFFRRVSLDLTGRLPSPESVRAFLDDPRPSRAKRAKMIDTLIASPEYVDHWAVKWGDLLQSSRKFLGEKGAYEFQQWIRDAIASNRPYDAMVRELLTARGSSYDNPAANYFRVTREAKPAMEKTTQVFLGVRMVCAQCHDHPFERWTQNQYYQMSAFFSAVGIRAGFEVGEEIVFDQRADYEMKHPKDGRVMKPQFMLAVERRSRSRRSRAARRPGGLAHLEGQSVLCQSDRQPDVELLRRARASSIRWTTFARPILRRIRPCWKR